MSILGMNVPGLIDLYKQQGSDGQVSAKVLELLKQQNPILEDIIMVECNTGATHKTVVRTGLPEPTWRQFYQGVQPTKSTFSQVVDTTGMLAARCEVDKSLAEISGNIPQFRLNQSKGHIEGMAQKMAQAIFYGNDNGEFASFKGLAPRFNQLTGAQNSSQVINAGGTGAANNTSIWFITWGETECHGIFPQGTKAGVSHNDIGLNHSTPSSNGGYYSAYVNTYEWHMGVSVPDWRYVSRVCNIDTTALKGGAELKLYDFMRQAYYANKCVKSQNSDFGSLKTAIYMNRDVVEALDAISTNSGATDNFIRLSPEDIEGKEVMKYRGIPIRVCDAILNTEEKVV